MQKYYSPDKETMSREQITELQSEALVAQVKRVYENVEYYRKKCEKAGVTPDDIKGIEDIEKLLADHGLSLGSKLHFLLHPSVK